VSEQNEPGEGVEDYHRAALRSRLESMLQAAEKRVLDSVKSSTRDLGGDLVDASSMETGWTTLSPELELAKRIREALTRLDDGEYGVCNECGTRIPAERLHAVPFATRCVHCQAAQEDAARRDPVRPKWWPGSMLVFIE
jgi:DnaK suppressor protein